MDAFNWLHLTDLHWGLTGQKHLWPTIRQKFFEDLEKLRPKTGPWHAVLFTGDFVQKGAKDEFDSLEDKVSVRCGNGSGNWTAIRSCWPCRAITISNGPPAKSRSAAVRWLRTPGRFQEIAEEFWEDEKSEYRREVKKTFANYRQWWATRPHCEKQDIQDGRLLPGDFSTSFVTAGGHKIGVLGLNTAFLQLGDEIKAGHLACDLRQFQRACEGDDEVAWAKRHDICLLMTHQPPEWLDDPSRKKQYPRSILPAALRSICSVTCTRRRCAGFRAAAELWSAGGRVVRCSVWNTTANRTRKTAATGIRRGRSPLTAIRCSCGIGREPRRMTR